MLMGLKIDPSGHTGSLGKSSFVRLELSSREPSMGMTLGEYSLVLMALACAAHGASAVGNERAPVDALLGFGFTAHRIGGRRVAAVSASGKTRSSEYITSFGL